RRGAACGTWRHRAGALASIATVRVRNLSNCVAGRVGVGRFGFACWSGLPWRLLFSLGDARAVGKPIPPNPPLEGEGFDRLFGYFVSVHAGARLSRNADR